MRSFYLSLVLIFSVFIFSSAASAQQQSATLSGQITDRSGAVVAGAVVTITDPSRGINQSTRTNQSGQYTIALLPPDDHYTLTVTAEGFATTSQHDLSLQVAQEATVNIALSPGTVSESVVITSQQPLLDTETVSQGQVLAEQTIRSLPLNGRSTFRLILFTPGVVFSNGGFGQFGDVPVNTTFDANFRINGGRASSNEFLIDGVPASTEWYNQPTTIPMPDETQEFKVESTNLAATYGRFAGGVINVSTKSGTDQIHGDVFEFLRNSVFDANDWFNDYNGKPKPIFRMNQFGGTVGAPVVLPHLYNGKGKTFFFFSYQGTRRAKGTPYTTTVPTDAERSGDFSAAGVTIYNPFSYDTSNGNRAAFAGNKIPSGLLDPAAVNIAKYYPEPNIAGAGLTNNYTNSAPVIVNQDTYSGRVDQQVTSRYRLFGRYSATTTALTQPNEYGNIADNAGSVGTTHFRTQSFSFGNTYAFNENNLLSVSYGFARWHQLRTTLSYGFQPASLGFASSFTNDIQINMFPAVNLTGYGSFAGQSYFNNGNDSHAIIAQFTHVSGRSTLSLGADGRMHRINFYNNANPAGVFAFTQQFTRQNNVASSNGNAFASFLLGTGSSGSAIIANGDEMQDFYGALYAQDDYKVTPRLTLNLGIRYDGESPFLDRRDALNYFDPTVTSPAANPSFPNLTGGLVFANTDGHGRAVYTRDHDNIAPRIGFAYAASSTTSVRGGYAIVYSPLELTSNGVGTVPNQGYSSTTNWNTGITAGSSVANGLVPVNLLSNPYPSGLIQVAGSSQGAATQLGQTITVWQHHPRTPYNQQYSFDIQQQVSSRALFEIAYIGSHAVHLTSPLQLDYLPKSTLYALKSGINTQVANPFAPYISIGTLSQATVAQKQLLLPFPQFTSVMEDNATFGSNSYNSLVTKFELRSAHGVTMLVSYVWSKDMSNVNAQDAPIGNVNQSTTPQDWGNLKAERSVSEMDIPNNFMASVNAELPFGKGKALLNRGGIANAVAGGWAANGIFMAQDGFPLTLSAGSVSWGANRVDRVPGVSPKIHGDRSNTQRIKEWFNPAAFTVPTNYTYGTERRTTTDVRKPGLENLDFSLIKTTRVNDHLNTEFHAEMFNVSNTPHFAPPGMVIDGSNFGVITSDLTAPPGREMQFALKLLF
ncbi:TonB-dependent receptor domain-containing protein [Silvibacterium acidisoli]|uniref:TonB-dependent receptor domain-containing protein n=1 Tax=Acidobacteriaceae bacterium ZG23-2 TaxID=2883246 RepID=UPI00406C7238